MLLAEQITAAIIAAFYAVYDELGYGFLEATYCSALARELTKRGVPFARETMVNVYYKGDKVGLYRADFLVAGQVVLEIKSTEIVGDADRRQLLNYLRSTTLEVGLLLHFGPKASFKRVIFENDRKRSLPAAS
jgi:GxxExxY protein